MTPSFRWLDKTDLRDWRDIRCEALRNYPSSFLTTLAEFEARSDVEIETQLAQGLTLGGFVAGRLMGTAAYIRKTGPTVQHRAEIGAVYVRDEARGTGLAAGLMAQVEIRARSEGVSQLELNVETRNAAAIRFYEKLGYERFGVFPGIVKTEAGLSDDYFYVKTLEA